MSAFGYGSRGSAKPAPRGGGNRQPRRGRGSKGGKSKPSKSMVFKVPEHKTTYECRYYYANGNYKACIGMTGGYVDDFKPEQFLKHDRTCMGLVNEMMSHYGHLLRETRLKMVSSHAMVTINGGLEPNHVIFNFWMSRTSPDCTLKFKDTRTNNDNLTIYRWDGMLDSAVASPGKNLPAWLKAVWEKEPIFKENSYLVLQMDQPDYRLSPTIEGWFQPFEEGFGPQKETWPEDRYLIRMRYPVDQADHGLLGFATISKVDWIAKRSDRIEYLFQALPPGT